MSASRTGPVEELAFLVGRWRGAGTLRGRPVVTRSTCETFAETMLRMDVETYPAAGGPGATPLHRERILWRRGDGARPDACTTSPWRGDAQSWTVESLEPGRAWRQTHPGFVWEIRRTDAGYEETFDRGSERIVALSHVRETAT